MKKYPNEFFCNGIAITIHIEDDFGDADFGVKFKYITVMYECGNPYLDTYEKHFVDYYIRNINVI